ncbi:MAG TPA: site-specific DNA-methyltransferase [Rhodanobacteraceae bacterium]|nr:site-specific DNA-methyltransferase [Rhodanobacteraceae bacterium]
MSGQIHVGDCLEVMRGMPAESVQCCVTSPPYYGLRDYDVRPTSWPATEATIFPAFPPLAIPAMECCLGLEPDPWAFIAHCVEIFREVRRLLRNDGTLWLNIGDSYCGARRGGQGDKCGLEGSRHNQRESRRAQTASRRRDDEPIPRSDIAHEGLKSKDMLGIPWMLAFALRADGWYLRQDIIWSKTNPMPESVRDRCAKAHEYMFLLSKSPRYYFDAEAIAEPIAAASIARLSQPNLANQAGSVRVPGKSNGPMKAVGPRFGGDKYGADAREQSRTKSGNEWTGDSGTRNKRSVWTVATQPFKEAHFATFPPALVEPCILAGSPGGGVVLDPFSGAGTTALVAEELGRQYIGIELNPEYAEIADARLETAKPGLPLGGTACTA